MANGFPIFCLLSVSSVMYLLAIGWICCMHACMDIEVCSNI